MAESSKNSQDCVKVKNVEVAVKYSGDRKHKDEVSDALLEFKKHVKKSEILQDLRKYECYTAPSKARRLKWEESQRKKRRDLRKQQWYAKNHKDF